MASVRRLKEGDPKSPWIVEYTDGSGKRRRKTPRTGLKKDADALRQAIEREMGDGIHVPDSETNTVKAAIESWLDTCDRRAKIGDGLTLSSASMYRHAAKRVYGSYLSRMKVKDVTTIALQAFADGLIDKGLSAKSIGHTFLVLKLTFDHAIARGWTKVNMLRLRSRETRVRLPAIERRTSIPSREQLRIVIAKASERLPGETDHSRYVRVALINVALHCGMRPGEIAALKWENVDLVAGVIRVRHSLSAHDGLKSTKTRAGLREVSMAPVVLDALVALKNAPGRGRTSEDGFVFVTRRGLPYTVNNLREHWDAIRDSLGLNHRLYDLRHAAASLRIAHGLSPLHIKTFMGHSRIETTLNVYGHLFPEDAAIKNASAAIAASLAPDRMGSADAT